MIGLGWSSKPTGLERRCCPAERTGEWYARRWQEGARTLSELDPRLQTWIARRCRRRALKVIVLLMATALYVAALTLSLAGILAGHLPGT